jgi:hypothetical protein
MNTREINLSDRFLSGVITLDSRLLGTEISVKENRAAYRIAIATWYTLFVDHGLDGHRLYSAIENNGLVRVIDTCNKLYDATMANAIDAFYLEYGHDGFVRYLIDNLRDPVTASLLLRYLRRFKPQGVLIDEKGTLRKFRDRHKRARVYNNTPQWRKEFVYKWMRPHTTAIEAVAREVLDPNDLALPSGADYEGHTTHSDKIRACEQFDPFFLQVSGCRMTSDPSGSSRVAVVPKSYKASRLIALEECSRTTWSQPLAQSLRDALKIYSRHRINLDDQTLNQNLCRIAAGYGLATIDWSSASDSIYHAHVQELYPWTYSQSKGLVCSRLEVGSDKLRMQIFSTMGHRLTFPLLSCTMYALARAAYDVYEVFSGEYLDVTTIGVYGDDLIVDERVVDIVLDFAEALDFTMNVEKSYFGDQGYIDAWHGHYRESCGAEYLYDPVTRDIFDLATPFYPRSGIGNDDIVTMISLQHRLYAMPATNQWLTSYIRDTFTRMFPDDELTMSEPGSPYDDIWDYYPNISYKDHPIGSNCFEDRDDRNKYEYHTVFVTDRGNADNSFVSRDAASRYAYCEFLHRGPHYSSAFDEMLGITTQNLTRSALISTPGKVRPAYTL